MPKDQVEILLVEDDANDVRLTLHALEEAQICNSVQVTRDGEEALDFLFCRGAFQTRDRNCHPKLVLLDLKLPKLNGFEVLREIRGSPSTRSIPVTVLTSSRREEDLIASYGLGVNSYIQKPVDFDQFREAVKTVGYYWLLVNHPPVPSALPETTKR